MFSVKKALEHTILKDYVVFEKLLFAKLDVSKAFGMLNEKEKHYAHNLSRASWVGYMIEVGQASEESPAIMEMFFDFFNHFSDHKILKEKIEKEIKEEGAYQNFMNYAAQFFANGGNYLSFGDTKFIPRCEIEIFEKIIKLAKNKNIEGKFQKIKKLIYSLESDLLELGFNEKRTNSLYYSSNVTKDEIENINEFLRLEKIGLENTRVFKEKDNFFTIRIASAMEEINPAYEKEWKNYKIKIQYCDFQKEMRKIGEYLEKAKQYASNELEKNMLEEYVDFFNNGNIESHKKSQGYWVKNKGPIIETNIGFIESYRDPSGVRGEFEGWVACVNKEASKQLEALVSCAPEVIKTLPWNEKTNGFEKDVFSKPDFTSLDVLTFASSGIPIGINVPNYNEIRQDIGFKNVSLGNVMKARSSDKQDFLSESDERLFNKHYAKALEVNVALHELIGHGSGKVLIEKKDGSKNFKEDLINPLTGKAVENWYQEGETWSSKFGEWSNRIEECRAESVSIFLAYNENVKKVFDIDDDICYAQWVEMILAGLKSLPYYSSEKKKWMQAHACARFAILKRLIEAKIVEVKLLEDDVLLQINRKAIPTLGQSSIGDFLRHIQIYRSTGNVKDGVDFFKKYVEMNDFFLKVRDIVIKKKKPRSIYVQSETFEKDGKVFLKEYKDINESGVITSFIDHLQDLKKL